MLSEEWLNEPVFKDWLLSDSKDKTKAGKEKKHLEKLIKVNNFFSFQKMKDWFKFCLTNQCFEDS